MTNFYIFTALLIALSCLFVVIPLLRKAKLNQLEVTNANVVKQRMTELDQELTEGLISEKDKITAVRELKLALVEESDRVDSNTAVSDGKVNWFLVGLLSLPALVLGAWVYFNANQLTGLQAYIAAQSQAADLTARIQGQNGAEVTPNDYAKFALVIRKRLRETPDDVEGWRLLGQVHMAIGRMEESIAAFEKALDLAPRDLALRERYAQALMVTGSEESLENAKRQTEYLLTLLPDNRDYRLLLTAIATQLGDADTALRNFMMIRGELSPDSTFYQSLVAQLINIGVPASAFDAGEADSALGQGEQQRTEQNAAANPEQTAGPALKQSMAQSIEQNMQQSPARLEAQTDISAEPSNRAHTSNAGASIQVNVSLAPDIADKMPASGFLIVFAQNAESDSRIPLAVKRMPLSDFPITVSLSDEDAMMPSMTLSSVSKARITARISQDADVMPTAGELQGQIDTLDLVKGQTLQSNLVINKELE